VSSTFIQVCGNGGAGVGGSIRKRVKEEKVSPWIKLVTETWQKTRLHYTMSE
jgi:hypothetical protein